MITSLLNNPLASLNPAMSFSPLEYFEPSSALQLAQEPVDVMSNEDIFVGVIIAVTLAFTASFLQGQRSQSDFVLWENDGLREEAQQEGNVVFDAEAWKEMSQPDNYILYKRKLKEREDNRKNNREYRMEKAWVLVALLVLFVPIFSVEFFFALSRQVICGGNPLNQADWAQQLCSPANLGEY